MPVVQKRRQRWALIQHVVGDLCSCMLQMFFRHSASPLSRLLCMTAVLWGFGGGRSEQNRSDIKQRAAPSCTVLEGSLDVLLNMKGLMAGRPNGSTGPRARGRQGTYWLHVHAYVCTHTCKRGAGTKTHSHSNKDKKRNTHTDKITHAHGRNSNNAIRDSLMILEGRVCGLPLIFPLSLLIPQSLLQRKKPSRAAREQGRQTERVRKEELPTYIKKQEKEGWEWVEPSGKIKNQTGSSCLAVPAEEAMDSWQPTALTATPQALAGQQGWIWPEMPPRSDRFSLRDKYSMSL